MEMDTTNNSNKKVSYFTMHKKDTNTNANDADNFPKRLSGNVSFSFRVFEKENMLEELKKIEFMNIPDIEKDILFVCSQSLDEYTKISIMNFLEKKVTMLKNGMYKSNSPLIQSKIDKIKAMDIKELNNITADLIKRIIHDEIVL